LDHEVMSGKPDMTIHTLTHFLDRFVYRTPKASATSRGASIMQPLAGGEASDRLVEAGKSAPQGQPLNSENFWKKRADEVAAEDVFFHEYFNRVNKDKTKVKKGKGADDAVDEDGADLSDNESEIWKALVDSRPELEADDDDDDDLDMDDLDSEFDDDDDEDEEGEGAAGSDDEVIFNDESDVPSDEDVAEASDFDMDEEIVSPPPSKKASKKEAAKKAAKVDKEDDSDDFDMDVSDEEAFFNSDDDLPSDMELGGVELEPKADAADNKKKRRKLKHLPTFASADDYAALLADEDEGM
jgi:ribosome biogenesis protein MAK21